MSGFLQRLAQRSFEPAELNLQPRIAGRFEGSAPSSSSRLEQAEIETTPQGSSFDNPENSSPPIAQQNTETELQYPPEVGSIQAVDTLENSKDGSQRIHPVKSVGEASPLVDSKRETEKAHPIDVELTNTAGTFEASKLDSRQYRPSQVNSPPKTITTGDSNNANASQDQTSLGQLESVYPFGESSQSAQGDDEVSPTIIPQRPKGEIERLRRTNELTTPISQPVVPVSPASHTLTPNKDGAFLAPAEASNATWPELPRVEVEKHRPPSIQVESPTREKQLKVSIGTIEVNVEAKNKKPVPFPPTPPTNSLPSQPSKALSLNDYLSQRKGGRR